MFGTLIRIINLPLRIAEDTASRIIEGEPTDRNSRIISSPLEDLADAVDDIEKSAGRSLRR